jgi:elongation factor 4
MRSAASRVAGLLAASGVRLAASADAAAATWTHPAPLPRPGTAGALLLLRARWASTTTTTTGARPDTHKARNGAPSPSTSSSSSPSTSTTTTPPSRIRNFSIIAHIDHGKSTLADRLLTATGTVPDRDMRAQFLDSMDLERERGITIKLNQARMVYTSPSDGQAYTLNLIDTPGHVDFSYEVSRSLAACEGALLVVDAAQGVQAQTLANVGLALEHDLEIIPVLNKIDLPGADPDRVAAEVEDLIGLDAADAVRASAKTGLGVGAVLEAIVARVPPPPDNREKPLRALIFDSAYDPYRGVIVYFRVVDGSVAPGDTVQLMATGKMYEVDEVGVLAPGRTPVARLGAGEVGYLAASIKAVADARVGDTLTLASDPASTPLPGYREAKPMVFCGLFPTDADQFADLRDALAKLQLNDAALAFEPEVSPAMGCGFRCGFLGLLHMEVVQERLEREYGLDLITTAPTVVYRLTGRDGATRLVSNPADVPQDVSARSGGAAVVEEPYARVDIITPAAYVGPLMDLAQARRGEAVDMKFVGGGGGGGNEADRSGGGNPSAASGRTTALLSYDVPLAEVVTDFFDELKSRSRGYASMEYAPCGYRASDLVRLDVRINGEVAEPLAAIVHRDAAYRVGRSLVQKLKGLIPRHQFRVPLQASIGSRVIASEAIPALRKDVLAKCALEFFFLFFGGGGWW